MFQKIFILILFTIGLTQFMYVAVKYLKYYVDSTADIQPKSGRIFMPSMSACVSRDLYHNFSRQELEYWLYERHYPILNSRLPNYGEYDEYRGYDNYNKRFYNKNQYLIRAPTVYSFVGNDVCITFMSALFGDRVNLTSPDNFKVDVQQQGAMILVHLDVINTTSRIGIHPPNTPPQSFYEGFVDQNISYMTRVLSPMTEYLLPEPYTTRCRNYSEKSQNSGFFQKWKKKVKSLFKKRDFLERLHPKSYEDCLLLCHQENCACLDQRFFYTTDPFPNFSDGGCRCRNWNRVKKRCRRACPRDCLTEHYIENIHFQSVFAETSVFIRRNRDELDYHFFAKYEFLDLLEEVGSLISLWFDLSVPVCLLFVLYRLGNQIRKHSNSVETRNKIMAQKKSVQRLVTFPALSRLFTTPKKPLTATSALRSSRGLSCCRPVKAGCPPSTSASKSISSFRDTSSEMKRQRSCAASATSGTSTTAWRSST